MTSTDEYTNWPTAQLDSIRRLRILASTVPGLHVSERIMPALFEDVWSVASDLEYELPRLGAGFVTGLRITERIGDQLIAQVDGPFGISDRFEITLRPGWCWMEGRVLAAAMAATPVDVGTHFAWATVMKVPGGRLFAPVSAVALRRTLRNLERRALERISNPDS